MYTRRHAHAKWSACIARARSARACWFALCKKNDCSWNRYCLNLCTYVQRHIFKVFHRRRISKKQRGFLFRVEMWRKHAFCLRAFMHVHVVAQFHNQFINFGAAHKKKNRYHGAVVQRKQVIYSSLPREGTLRVLVFLYFTFEYCLQHFPNLFFTALLVTSDLNVPSQIPHIVWSHNTT